MKIRKLNKKENQYEKREEKNPPFWADKALKNIGKFLERHPLPVPGVCHGPDHAERSVPDGPVRLEVRARGRGLRTYID